MSEEGVHRGGNCARFFVTIVKLFSFRGWFTARCMIKANEPRAPRIFFYLQRRGVALWCFDIVSGWGKCSKILARVHHLPLVDRRRMRSIPYVESMAVPSINEVTNLRKT